MKTIEVLKEFRDNLQNTLDREQDSLKILEDKEDTIKNIGTTTVENLLYFSKGQIYALKTELSYLDELIEGISDED